MNVIDAQVCVECSSNCKENFGCDADVCDFFGGSASVPAFAVFLAVLISLLCLALSAFAFYTLRKREQLKSSRYLFALIAWNYMSSIMFLVASGKQVFDSLFFFKFHYLHPKKKVHNLQRNSSCRKLVEWFQGTFRFPLASSSFGLWSDSLPPLLQIFSHSPSPCKRKNQIHRKKIPKQKKSFLKFPFFHVGKYLLVGVSQIICIPFFVVYIVVYEQANDYSNCWETQNYAICSELVSSFKLGVTASIFILFGITFNFGLPSFFHLICGI